MRAWPGIAARARAAQRWAFFLDFDGTLANLRARPADARLSREAKRVLQRLVRHDNVMVIVVSGRRLKTLRRLVPVAGVRYVGLHGAEQEAGSAALSGTARAALLRAKHDARRQLHSLPGIQIEDKGLSFAVHYRAARPRAVREGAAALRKVLGPANDYLRALNGYKVWEILPREIAGKGAAVREILDRLPGETLAFYVGDDDTDESALAALEKEITVRVRKVARTHAHYYLRNPAEVRRFLARLEKELP